MKLADYINSLGMNAHVETTGENKTIIYFDNVEQDFFIEVETELGIYDYWVGFDIEDEVTMWLEAKRNGFRGVPNILELVEEEKTIEETLHELWIKTQDWKTLSMQKEG